MLFNRDISFDKNDINSIINACIAGNRSAEDALVNRSMAFAKDMVYIYAQNTRECDEMIDDSFLKVFSSLRSFNQTGSFKAWFRIILRNTINNYHKKNKQTEPNLAIADYEFMDIGQDVLSKLSTDELLVLVGLLTPSCERVFKMNVIEGHTHKEIARVMGITEGTSKSNLNDARLKLQDLVKKHYPSIYLTQTINKKPSHDN